MVVFAYSGLLLMYYASPLPIGGVSLLGATWHYGGPAGGGVLIWLPFLWLLTWSLIHRGRMMSQPMMRASKHANITVCVLWVSILIYIGTNVEVGLSEWLLLSVGTISGLGSLAGLLRRDTPLSYYLSYYPPVFLSAGLVCFAGMHIGSVAVVVGFGVVLWWDIVTDGGRRKDHGEERSGLWQGWVWICRAWFVLGVLAGISLGGLSAVNTILPLGSHSQMQPRWAIIAMNVDAFLRGGYVISMAGLCGIPLVWSTICLRRMTELRKHSQVIAKQSS